MTINKIPDFINSPNVLGLSMSAGTLRKAQKHVLTTRAALLLTVT